MANEIGFVYVLSNQSMPGFYKIGMTMRSPTARAIELGRVTGVPSDFVVEYYAEFPSPRDIERELHEDFAYCRPNAGREFFKTDLGVLVERIASLGPISSWETADASFAVYKFAKEFNESMDQLASEVELMRGGKA